ncbi:hypothetical protein COLSTE_02356 [Collinsella stercoris DSM 13279]|uniref:Uncharacterized protein n=1 Tax=Collinsella stercoris DSM 13279 TaxID=445975 RepID=B6GE20_9ACTN|nr:hypothetical protein COLSTE_02356 [Collinsella stercoris DSM 13279]
MDYTDYLVLCYRCHFVQRGKICHPRFSRVADKRHLLLTEAAHAAH